MYEAGVPSGLAVSPYVRYLLSSAGRHRMWWLAIHSATSTAVGGLRLSTRAGPTGRDVIGDSVAVEELSVDPSHQRVGLATALLDAVHRWLAGRSDLTQTVGLGVETDNHPAIALYAKLGYVVAVRDGSPIVFRGGNDRPCHVMFRRLVTNGR
jgi:GNAT superfamily N-acetyltransferase